MLHVNANTFKIPGQPISESSVNALLSVVGLSLGPELIGNHVTYFLDIAQALLESIYSSSAWEIKLMGSVDGG